MFKALQASPPKIRELVSFRELKEDAGWSNHNSVHPPEHIHNPDGSEWKWSSAAQHDGRNSMHILIEKGPWERTEGEHSGGLGRR